ncbi:SOS-response transcriptional regulator UmuD-like protein [Emticicia aquatilis]|uniref:SOS-response transcriptional regulator UmuD-like protein n=1 Tax=Emticicia aquatilis TaxID=1537369 RepID=A0A916YHU8_9BACT|nr:translesion error-prone DNA polymerase V autoproteolytic subunit [Emticicia aquatilis]GGD45698.1 SOS-response transcriptional regulator UmuD-like protein [Emticicia aquatilis]
MSVIQIQDSTIDITPLSAETELRLPFVDIGISAGFPSPALDFTELSIDLNKYLIKNKPSTFCGFVKGHSMKNVGIFDGDILIIDKSLEPINNKIAVCFIDGEFTLKRIRIEKKQCWLLAENEDYKPIKVTEENDFIIWGIITFSIKSF